MSVVRVVKTRGYTVMSNHHLRDKGLSFKAKGLMSVMLSLPEEWDYTVRGLASISMEGMDAVRSGIAELERAGYVTRQRVRGAASGAATTRSTNARRTEPQTQLRRNLGGETRRRPHLRRRARRN